MHSVQALLVLLVGHTRHLAQTLAVFANGVPPLNVLLKKNREHVRHKAAGGTVGVIVTMMTARVSHNT